MSSLSKFLQQRTNNLNNSVDKTDSKKFTVGVKTTAHNFRIYITKKE